MNFLKKLNKVYTAVFGDECSNYPTLGGSNEPNRPISDAVRSLTYQVNNQAQIIEALVKHLNLEIEREYSELSVNSMPVLKKKKN